MVIYQTTNLINGKFYVGKDAKNRDYYLGSGVLLKRAIKKYGKANFEKRILEHCKSPEHLNERERYWIAETKAIMLGYNLTEGGTGGVTSVGPRPNRRGIPPWNKGLKGVQTAWNKGLVGVNKSNQTSFKAGKDHSLYGLTQSEETVEKRVATRRANGSYIGVGRFAKKVVVAECEREGTQQFESIKEAAKHFKISYDKVRYGAAINRAGERELWTQVGDRKIKFY